MWLLSGRVSGPLRSKIVVQKTFRGYLSQPSTPNTQAEATIQKRWPASIFCPMSKAQVGLWCSGLSPALLESWGAETGADFIIVDAQHGSIGMDRTLEMIRALVPLTAASQAKTKCVVRVSYVNDAEICKYLDAGAHGLIAPMVNTPALCQAFVSGALYPPLGVRSFGPYRQSTSIQNFTLEEANKSIITLAMIETQEAYNNLTAILETPNLSGIFIGPNDLAVSMGFPPSSFPSGKVLETVLDIAKRAREQGKLAGIFCANSQGAKFMVESGFNFVSVGMDSSILNNFGKSELEHARS